MLQKASPDPSLQAYPTPAGSEQQQQQQQPLLAQNRLPVSSVRQLTLCRVWLQPVDQQPGLQVPESELVAPVEQQQQPVCAHDAGVLGCCTVCSEYLCYSKLTRHSEQSVCWLGTCSVATAEGGAEGGAPVAALCPSALQIDAVRGTQQAYWVRKRYVGFSYQTYKPGSPAAQNMSKMSAGCALALST